MNKTIWKQLDSRWSGKPYPTKSASFGGNGCGCCACVHVAMEQDAKKNWTPENLRPWMIEQGFAIAGQGTTWSGITETLKHIGHKTVVRIWDDPMSAAWKELNKGNRIGILLFNSNVAPNGTKWTASGHYVAFTNYRIKDSLHQFYCKDSGGRNHDGWYSYEKSMKGCIAKLWIVEKLSTKKAPTYKDDVIDVSYVQSKDIDWKKVKADGIAGAIIRCGFRGYESAKLQEDMMFRKHIKGAHAAGLKVGVYFFTEAINAAEGKEEAAYAVSLVKKVGIPLSYPIAVDTEAINAKNVRANNISRAKRTEAIKAFCEEIKRQGYEPMIYASTSWLNNKIDMSKLPYKVWCAQYHTKCEYKGSYILWQYTSTGSVDGVSGNVDVSHSYIKEETTKTKAAEVTLTRDKVIANMKAWAKKITGEKYHYVNWKSNDDDTHTCPICKGRKYDNHFGWNCIGFAFAVWHHGGGLKSKCNCHVISNDIAEKIAKAKTDAEALKIVKSHVGIDDVEVLRNNGKNVPKSKWQPGDIGMQFVGDTYKHTFFIMGDGKIADSSGRSKTADQIAVRNDNNYSARVIIRWTGGNKEKSPSSKEKGKYTGKLPTIKLIKSNAEVIADAIRWAIWIAGDNSFHYGYTNKHGSSDPSKWDPNAHHNGCYFCKTNTTKGGRSKKGIVDYERTYCCNPFVGAAWAHGGCVPEALKLCQNGKSWDFGADTAIGYNKSKLFDNLGHPAKSKLKPGDVLCKDTHVALYIGDGKIAEAGSGDDNKKGSAKWNNSIRVRELTDALYKGFPRVHRFNSSVNTTAIIRHGEVSERVKLLQAFLNWYFDGKVGKADGIFGDNTLKWIKKFQEAEIGKGEGDGLVGEKTIAAMSAVKK